MPDLLNEYAVGKSLNTQNKVKKAYARFDLLIIDEWLLRPLPEPEAYDLLELIDAGSVSYTDLSVYAKAFQERTERKEAAAR